MTEIQNHTR